MLAIAVYHDHPFRAEIEKHLRERGLTSPYDAHETEATSRYLFNNGGSSAVIRLYTLSEEGVSHWFWFEFGAGLVRLEEAGQTLARCCEIMYHYPCSLRPAVVEFDEQAGLLVVLNRGITRELELHQIRPMLDDGLNVADRLRAELKLRPVGG